MDPDQDMHEGFEPTLVDLDGDPVWVHGCENDEGNVAIHLIMSESMGECDMGEEHFVEVSHVYDAGKARQLAAALLNAADMLDGLATE